MSKGRQQRRTHLKGLRYRTNQGGDVRFYENGEVHIQGTGAEKLWHTFSPQLGTWFKCDRCKEEHHISWEEYGKIVAYLFQDPWTFYGLYCVDGERRELATPDTPLEKQKFAFFLIGFTFEPPKRLIGKSVAELDVLSDILPAVKLHATQPNNHYMQSTPVEKYRIDKDENV